MNVRTRQEQVLPLETISYSKQGSYSPMKLLFNSERIEKI